MKPVLLLQLRKNDLAAEGEFNAFLRYGGLSPDSVLRIRMEQDLLPTTISLDEFSAVMVGGGPWNISDHPDEKSIKQLESEGWLFRLLEHIIASDFPYLGACYGFGALVSHQSGITSKERYSEPVAAVTIKLTEDGQTDPLLMNLPHEFRAFVGHKEACQATPNNTVWLASSETCPYQMLRIGQNVYATQFHPELDPQGICDRIDVYKNAGYFPPEEAEPLKQAAMKEEVVVPKEILRRFCERYCL